MFMVNEASFKPNTEANTILLPVCIYFNGFVHHLQLIIPLCPRIIVYIDIVAPNFSTPRSKTKNKERQ